MFEFISYISSNALDVIEKLGYSGIFMMSLAETIIVPIPSELVITFAGFLAASGKFSLWLVIVVSTLGNLLGSVLIFYIGKIGGRWFLERYGKYVLIHKKDLAIGDKWFLRHGTSAVFWGRMVPAVRSFISLPAGIANMNFLKFLSYSFIGAFIWTSLMAYIGFKFKTGDNAQVIESYLDKFEILGAGLLVAGAIWYIIWHRKKRKIIKS